MGKARTPTGSRPPEGRTMSTTATKTAHRRSTPAPQAKAGATRARILGRYLAVSSGQEREVAWIALPDGGAVVVDYRRNPVGDGRLVARLAPDEPVENARVVCGLYLAGESRGRCRSVSRHDFDVAEHPAAEESLSAEKLCDAEGYVYRLREVTTASATLELRWTRSCSPGGDDHFETVFLRDLVGSLQAYEPALSLTLNALADCAAKRSTSRLRKELDRLAKSPIVLNRQLRHEVQRRVERGEVSMNEIAIRCGRVRRGSRNNGSGDTTWLARRIGEKPDPITKKPTPWIHTEVLAIIARDGLGISPREAEL